MKRGMYCGAVFFLVLLLMFVSGRSSSATDSTTVLRVGCPDVSAFPDGSPEQLLFSYTKRYLDEISRNTGWQYEYVPLDEVSAREMLRAGRIDLYFPAEYRQDDQQDFSYSINNAAFAVLSLYVKEGSTMNVQDPSVLSGKRIGVLADGVHDYAVVSLLRDEGITVEILKYATPDELHQALANGAVDAIANRATQQRDGETLLMRTALLPACFLAAKHREGLIKNLSDFVYYTETVNPSFETHLTQVFLDRAQSQIVRFTAKETAYLANATDLRVAYVGGHSPFFGERLEDGVPDGIYPSILQALGEKLDLRFRFVRAEDNDHALKMLREGEADLFFCIYNNLPSMRDFFFTATFASEDFSYVVRRGTGEIPTGAARVALPRWFYGARTYLNIQHPNWQIVPLDEPADCLRLLEDDGCDFALLPSLFLQQSSLLSLHPSLVVIASYSTELPVSIAISDHQPRVLQSVLTKGILKLDARRVQEIVNEHMMGRLTLTAITARYPMQTVALAVILLLSIFIAMFLIERSRTQRHQADVLLAKNEELEKAIEEQQKLMRARDIYKQEAELDPLTGLLNKKAIQSACEAMLDGPLKDGAFHAFFIMDLDHFKEMNDTYGHQAGDAVLRRFAQDVRSIFRQSDHIGRFGGDEFTVLMPNVTTPVAVERHARQLMTAAQELEVRDDRSLLSVSIGIALAPMHGTTYDELFLAADAALYDVKRAGRNGWKIYDVKADGGMLCPEGE